MTQKCTAVIRRKKIREQIPLFPALISPRKARLKTRAFGGTDTRQRLSDLLSGDLDFHDTESRYASHNFHAFAAKFPPQLPRLFIEGLTLPGASVLDPMMGSGTTIVEAFLTGRFGIGVDLDPLALRICQVKVTPLQIDSVHAESVKLLSRASRLAESTKVERELERRFDEPTKEFIDYWFLPATQRELVALTMAIESEDASDLRRFFELCLSSIIITKSGGVSMARDLAHSRPHFDKSKQPKNALEQFSQRLRKSLKSLEELGRGTGKVCIQNGDARCLALADRSIDLVITSPPYANAIDYMRAHKFSLVWLGKAINELSDLRSTYIGSEKAAGGKYAALPKYAEATIKRLAEVDKSKATILRKYFVEMCGAIQEMHRVLKSGSAAIVVVGTSTMRGMDVQTHLCLADIGASVGFDVASVAQRTLDRNRRMMPARFGKKTDSMIEQRMHEEYVIGFLKP